jgi:hypothetical protein
MAKMAMTSPVDSPELAVVWDYAVQYGLVKENRPTKSKSKLVFVPTQEIYKHFVYDVVDLTEEIVTTLDPWLRPPEAKWYTPLGHKLASSGNSEAERALEGERRLRLVDRTLLKLAIL